MAKLYSGVVRGTGASLSGDMTKIEIEKYLQSQ